MNQFYGFIFFVKIFVVFWFSKTLDTVYLDPERQMRTLCARVQYAHVRGYDDRYNVFGDSDFYEFLNHYHGRAHIFFNSKEGPYNMNDKQKGLIRDVFLIQMKRVKPLAGDFVNSPIFEQFYHEWFEELRQGPEYPMLAMSNYGWFWFVLFSWMAFCGGNSYTRYTV
jgi:hypothetical protein